MLDSYELNNFSIWLIFSLFGSKFTFVSCGTLLLFICVLSAHVNLPFIYFYYEVVLSSLKCFFLNNTNNSDIICTFVNTLNNIFSFPLKSSYQLAISLKRPAHQRLIENSTNFVSFGMCKKKLHCVILKSTRFI